MERINGIQKMDAEIKSICSTSLIPTSKILKLKKRLGKITKPPD